MSGRADGSDGSTPGRILDVAERLVQVRGYSGFSYADVASELQLTKPALHYHFRSKAALGEALLERYTGRFTAALAALDASGASPPEKIEGYAALYLGVLREHRMCLCGMLAAEYPILPPSMQAAVEAFFERNEQWLVRVLEEGRTDRSLDFSGTPRDAARFIISTLEGAMLIARPGDDIARFEAASASLLAGLSAQPAKRPTRRKRAAQPDRR